MEEEQLLQNNPVNLIDEFEIEDDVATPLEDVEEELPRPQKVISKLPPSLRGLMGEANLQFARGKTELAKKMCFEIIRQAPDAFEPYVTLAQMHESHNVKKYKGFLMLAAHLQPSNVDIWCRLADLEIQENQVIAAISCYSRAIKAKPKDTDLHLKRLNLVIEKCPTWKRKVPILKLHLAKVLPKSKLSQILSICTETAKEYYKEKNYLRAIDALKICLNRIPEYVSQDVLNMTLELLLISHRYSECLDIFTQFCGFQFDVTVGASMDITINSFEMPENVHTDIKTKFIVCLVSLQSYQLVEPIIKGMLENDDVETNGMVYFEIAEALMASAVSNHYYKHALNLLIPLVKSKNFSLAAIWLKHAECLTHLQMYDQAIDAYKTVISLAPNHIDVLYPLAMLLLQQERKDEALEVLSQDLSSGKLHVAVLIEQMKLLKQIGDLDNYWKCCELLLSRHCIVFKNFEELRLVLSSTSIPKKWAKIAKLRVVKGGDDLEFCLSSVFEPSVADEYKLFLGILQFAFDCKAYTNLQKFAFMGLSSKIFTNHFTEILVIACFACIFTKDYYHGYLIARGMILQQPDNSNAWNFFSLMTMNLQESVKISRFFAAGTIKSKMPPELKQLIKANHYYVGGHFSHCLTYFIKDYKNTENCYSAFMIAVSMLQQYCQRKKLPLTKQTMLETVTYLFHNYAKRRSKYAQQEVYYNLGRMYQQIGVFYMAEHFYKLVFKVQNKYLKQYPDYLDLKQEAAYNLHVIYKSSGNFEAARRILYKYVVID